MEPSVSVVIPARDAAATIGAVVDAVLAQEPPVDEVIVVDDASGDETSRIAREHGAKVVRLDAPRLAGGARNRGWDEASGDVVVFLDSDAVPAHGWSAGLERALREFPGAVIACARTFTAQTRWGWVARLQSETPFLPRGKPREEPALSSLCMAVPRDAPIRWHESYGGEDGLFSVDALAAGLRLVFDPRFHAVHDHRRESYAEMRRQQRRVVYGFARGRHELAGEPLYRRLSPRLPLHYFILLRLPVIYGRVRADPELRERFLRLLPWLIVGEWTYGISASRYILSRPDRRAPARESF